MRIVRIRLEDGRSSYASMEDDCYRLLKDSPFEKQEFSGESVSLDNAKLLCPVEPKQIIAIGLNYRKHAEERNMPPPANPLIFAKTCNALIGPEDAIILPKMAPDEVDFEAELVMVIGSLAKNVPLEKAGEHICGFSCGNDISARDCQHRLDKQWTRGKSFDSFAPLGPWIETGINPENLRISLKLNGKTMQDSNTSDMIFSCHELLSYVSRCMTLYPGSVIMTGTPSGVGAARTPPVFLREGDNLCVEIEGIGRLKNSVTKED
ncbi:MAG: hypothetical protein A2X49_01225 [Lentisphaerae bacterium GWF2_52_8]|nr:MAG: hypothetical protein A2X49_01225 [Lentisphaerae bacterium GWF2_52_8]